MLSQTKYLPEFGQGRNLPDVIPVEGDLAASYNHYLSTRGDALVSGEELTTEEEQLLSNKYVLKTILLEVMVKWLDTGTDITKAVLLVMRTRGNAGYAIFSIAVKWLPAITALLHFHDINRQKLRICPREENRGVKRSLTNDTPQQAGQNGTLAWGRIIGARLIYLLFFPVASSLGYIRMVVTYSGRQVFSPRQRRECHADKVRCWELSVLGTAGEAPVQIVFTFWLLLREVIQAPDDVVFVQWREDRFGNPLPVPSLPLASIITSLLSLVISAVSLTLSPTSRHDDGRSAAKTSSRMHGCGHIAHFLYQVPRVLLCLASLGFRLLAFTIIWLFLDLKALVPMFAILVLNLLLASTYTSSLRYRAAGLSSASSSTQMFSTWMTATLGLAFPCVYVREEGQSASTIHTWTHSHLMLQNIIGCVILIVSQIIVLLLVNLSQFRYHDNLLSNTLFAFLSGFIICYGTIIVVYCTLSLHPLGKSWHKLWTGGKISLLAAMLISPFSIPVFAAHYDTTSTVYLLVQMQERDTLTIREVRGSLMSGGGSEELTRLTASLYQGGLTLIDCSQLLQQNHSHHTQQQGGSDSMVLLFNWTDTNCLQLGDEEEQVLNNLTIIMAENWEFRSSSPYPKLTGHLSFSHLRRLNFPASLVSLRSQDSSHLSGGEIPSATDTVTKIAFSLQPAIGRVEKSPSQYLTLSCPTFHCINVSTGNESSSNVAKSHVEEDHRLAVRLNRWGNPSADVELVTFQHDYVAAAADGSPSTGDIVYDSGRDRMQVVNSRQNLNCDTWSPRLDLTWPFCDVAPGGERGGRSVGRVGWDERLVENYRCCQENGNAVLKVGNTCAGRVGKENPNFSVVWGSWSRWSDCATAFTWDGRIRTERGRLRIGVGPRIEAIPCLGMERERLDCDTGSRTSPCASSPDINKHVPLCPGTVTP